MYREGFGELTVSEQQSFFVKHTLCVSLPTVLRSRGWVDRGLFRSQAPSGTDRREGVPRHCCIGGICRVKGLTPG